jgi:hypothetical protein
MRIYFLNLFFLALYLAVNPGLEAQESSAAGSYSGAVQEKVGEVAEIRFKELADSGERKEGVAESLMRLAKYRFFQDDFAGSEYYLRRLTEGFEGSVLAGEAKLWLGRTYLSRMELRAALVELNGGLEEQESRRIKNDDLIGRYLFWIGEVYLRDNKASEAREYFEKFSESYPGHPLITQLLKKLQGIYRGSGMNQAVEKVDKQLKDTEIVRKPTKDRDAKEKTRPPRESYLVQLASFSSNESAQKMLETLENRGIKARIREIELRQGIRYRIVIEGFESREKAEEKARKVKKDGYDYTIIKEWE